MEPHYTNIGTTMRSDPVNSMALLYPNGFDRNENRAQTPLVQVRDTADEGDSFVDEDFDYLSGSPSENVTVIIKFSSKTDSVVAETTKPCVEDKTSPNDDTPSLKASENVIDCAADMASCLSEYTSRDGFDAHEEIDQFHAECNPVNSTDNSVVVDDNSLGACAMDPTVAMTTDDDSNNRAQDSLYDEYEKMLEQPVRPERTRKKKIKQGQSYKSTEPEDGLVLNVCEHKPFSSKQESKAKSNDRQKQNENDNALKTTTKKPGEANDISMKTTINKPADATPEIRLEMVSPITKTPILVERTPSEDGDGEDFMQYLKELRKTSPVAIETGDNCVSVGNEIPYESTTCETGVTTEECSPDINGSNLELSIVELEDSAVENKQRNSSPVVFEPPSDNNSVAGDVIQISDEESGVNDSVVIVSDEEPTGNGLLDFNFASLGSGASNADMNEINGNALASGDCLDSHIYSVIEIESDSTSDTDEEEEGDTKSDEDTNYNRKHDNDNGDDGSDKGNGSSNNFSGNNQNSNGPTNGHDGQGPEHGNENNDNRDNSNSGNDKFSPGMRSRLIHSSETVLNENHFCKPKNLSLGECRSVEERPINEAGKCAAEIHVYSPEDIEVHQILDVTEKQSDLQFHFQTIDSYCFDTPSDISDMWSTSGKNSTTSQSTHLSKSPLKPDYSPSMSNKMSSRASTSSFDVFGETSSCVSDENNEDNVSLYENEIQAQDNIGFCENAIHEVCAKIQDLCQCGDEGADEGNAELNTSDENCIKIQDLYQCGDEGADEGNAELNTSDENCIKILDLYQCRDEQEDEEDAAIYISDETCVEKQNLLYDKGGNQMDVDDEDVIHISVDTSAVIHNLMQCKDICQEDVDEEDEINISGETCIEIQTLFQYKDVDQEDGEGGTDTDTSDNAHVKIQSYCNNGIDEAALDVFVECTAMLADSDTDSIADTETASDFESAIEEQFWANTAECSVADSDSDDLSENTTDEEANNLKEKQTPDEKETDSEYDSIEDEDDDDFVTDDKAGFDFMKELERRLTDASEESMIKVETNIDNNVSSPSQTIDTNIDKTIDKCEVDDAKNTLTENPVPTRELDEVNVIVTDNGNTTQGRRKSHRDVLEAAMKKQPRTISYQVPFIKEPINLPVNHRHMKKLKLVCKLRQRLLHRLLPRSTCFDTDTDDEDVQQVDETIKHFHDELDLERNTKHVKNELDENRNENEKPKAGDTVRLGGGFYIVGTGETLNLPVGPKPKQRTADTQDVAMASVYFRGIPGIINNAYKMSNSFSKQGVVTNESASHKILHACNRLATPQSPGKSKAKPEIKHGMMQQALPHDEVDENEDTDSSSSEMYELLLSAKDLLNSSRFEDAETTFLKLYNEIQEKPDHNGRLLVETLTGLADICIRQSRMCRSNPLEWQWLCMHAIALLQYTVEYCDSELENQLDNELIDWYQEHKQGAELKCRPLEDAFNRALYNCLKHDANSFDPFQSFSLPNTPVTQSRKSNLFPLSSTMPQYLVMPGMSYRVTDKGLTKHSADDSNVTVDWLAKFQHYCKDRLINKDSKGVTEKILKSNSSKNDDDTESILSAGSNGSLDWDHSDLQGIDEITVAISDQEISPENDYTFEYEIVTSDTEKEGWDFFINQRRNCNFESIVQMAVDGEKGDERHREMQSMTKETRDIYQHEKTEKTKRKIIEAREIISPLHEHSISLTLARLFCRLADKLVQEEEYRKAEAVYEKILDIIDHIQDGTAGMLRFSARIMKNLGTVKSKQGKSSSGLVLLNKALHTYRDLQEEEANFEIAIALIELGNGYIVGKNHEDSVFNDVIIAICDFFEKDAGDSQSVSTSSAGSASQLSQMTSSLGSNNEDRNVEEAVTCYTEAIALLDRYEADEKQVDMFAKSVMRLGDCYFMQNDYDKALECYEKSLTMFRANNMFGKDSLMENAHVLCMLGVSSFMLHVYPRAASVFEMALHMVRCAYGFKRTFLNGMLQSLSGITYYKMKNYHKCVSMCYQAHETYCEIFGEEMSRLDKQKFWLVCQTLYVMGNSYNILNLQAKAMKYLTIARSLMKSSKCRERRQFMRVLQILGDAYFAQYDYKAALQFYNEALEYGECESQISFDEVFDPNCASDEMTIHNHLVSKSAEAHLSMQQYQNAVHYLEQAHDMQEVMGEDIKEDLINTLNQLGYMHSVSGDCNKAIEAYKECLEVFREIHKGELGPEMCTTLGNLAAMCYVKACIAEDPKEDRNMTAAAENYFQNAMKLEINTEVCVKYGNFLYSHCKYEDAIVHLNNALSYDRMATEIVYGGLEKVTLPDLLQDEVDTQEEICLPSSCLARYLLILCHKAVHQTRNADTNLICLMEEVCDYDVPLLHSLLGYAMMELMMFEEAAICFLNAAENEEDYQLACENYCICLLILVQRLLNAAIDNIWFYYRERYGPTRF